MREINELEPQMRAKTDEELAAMTPSLRSPIPTLFRPQALAGGNGGLVVCPGWG